MNHIYSNSCEVHAGPVDVQINFGLRLPREPGKYQEGIEPQVVVCMSPQHAKSMVELLQTILSGWEAQHGEIRLPNGFNRMIH
jgi:hypothetical protein